MSRSRENSGAAGAQCWAYPKRSGMKHRLTGCLSGCIAIYVPSYLAISTMRSCS